MQKEIKFKRYRAYTGIRVVRQLQKSIGNVGGYGEFLSQQMDKLKFLKEQQLKYESKDLRKYSKGWKTRIKKKRAQITTDIEGIFRELREAGLVHLNVKGNLILKKNNKREFVVEYEGVVDNQKFFQNYDEYRKGKYIWEAMGGEWNDDPNESPARYTRLMELVDQFFYGDSKRAREVFNFISKWKN